MHLFQIELQKRDRYQFISSSLFISLIHTIFICFSGSDDVQRSIELLDRVLSEFDDVENANQVQNVSIDLSLKKTTCKTFLCGTRSKYQIANNTIRNCTFEMKELYHTGWRLFPS